MLIYVLQLAGAAACASSGALSAGRKSLDFIGVMVISLAAAVGGGTLRDLLLDRNPVFWLADNMYLYVSFGTGLLTWVYTRRWSPPMRLLLTVDAIGLALFTMTGTQIAEQMEQTVTICLAMGVITGVAGGIVRDILCGEIPMTFRRSELYASAALLGSGVYLGLKAAGLPTDACAVAGAVTVFLLRMAALRWNWHLPVFEFKDRH
jgi:uncharacterized membrane protein YeiH